MLNGELHIMHVYTVIMESLSNLYTNVHVNCEEIILFNCILYKLL